MARQGKWCVDKFVVFGRDWGKELSAEAKARKINRTELLRQACKEYLERHPVEDRDAA
jgi:hypothetical protein